MWRVRIVPTDQWYFVAVEDLSYYEPDMGGAFQPEKRAPDQIPAELARLGVPAGRIASAIRDLESGKPVTETF